MPTKMKKQTNTFKAILLGLGCLTFLPQMQAINPPPDGCYANLTTAEGCNALQNLTAGAGNTGVGWYSLFGTSTGNFNTGVGAGNPDPQQLRFEHGSGDRGSLAQHRGHRK